MYYGRAGRVLVLLLNSMTTLLGSAIKSTCMFFCFVVFFFSYLETLSLIVWDLIILRGVANVFVHPRISR